MAQILLQTMGATQTDLSGNQHENSIIWSEDDGEALPFDSPGGCGHTGRDQELTPHIKRNH
jgi:hypothetical protein